MALEFFGIFFFCDTTNLNFKVYVVSFLSFGLCVEFGGLRDICPRWRSFYLEKIKEKLDVRPWRINSDQGTSSDTNIK